MRRPRYGRRCGRPQVIDRSTAAQVFASVTTFLMDAAQAHAIRPTGGVTFSAVELRFQGSTPLGIGMRRNAGT